MLLILGIILVILSYFMAYWSALKYIIGAIGTGLIIGYLLNFL